MNERTKFRHPTELAALLAWRLKPSKRQAEVRLEGEGAPPEKIRMWERELTRHQHPCGCDQGAGGLLVGAVGFLLYLLLRPGGWGHPGWFEVWVGCGVIVVTTSAGKGLGILWARHKVRRVVREIQTEWMPRAPRESSYGEVVNVNVNRTRRCCGG